MFRYCCAVLFLFISIQLCAAERMGSIKGMVIDAKNSMPLSGAVVALTGTSRGAVADVDGRYEITDVASGSYELTVSYVTYSVYKQNVIITPGQDLVLDIKLVPENNDLKDHVVKSARITNTENAVINEIKTSNVIVSGTSAAQISKTMDRNAADVVKRIPGVTIQEDRFIVVRGLSDRYNTVWLNDASTPSSESDKKAFSFDIIPVGLIDRVLIYKTPAPDLPGDFVGGMVKVYSTSIAEKNQVAVNMQVSSREFSTGTDFVANAPSKTDWLGYDDGKRGIPGEIPGRISSKDPNYKANIGAWSKSFGNDWVVNTTKANPDARFSLALSNVLKIKKVKVGNTLGLSYSNTNTNYSLHRQMWDSVAKNTDYYDRRSANNVSVGLMDNIGVAVGNTKIEFKNLYNQIGTSYVTVRNAVPDSVADISPERAYAMGYQSRATYAAQLGGTHHNDKDTRKYNWTLGYTDLFKNEPDRRIIKYTKSGVGFDTVFKAPIPSSMDILNGGRFYSTLYEHTYSFSHQFTQKIVVTKNFNFDVSAGNYVEYKSRSFNIRELGYGISTGQLSQSILKLPVNEIFADSNVDGAKRFKISENTSPYDHYEGQNELVASFVSLRIPIGKHITIYGGARYEYNMQSLTAVVNLDTVTSDIKTQFLLPSVNAAYNFTDKSLVRVAYGKTLNRPEFREWAPSFYYNFDELVGNYGSLFPTAVSKNQKSGDTLKVAEIQNIDVRYEFYPSAGELVQVGAFYKSFKNPIQRVVVYNGGKMYTFINANSAYCYGLEIDVRKNMGWLDNKLHTNVFRDFTLVGNLALTKSQLLIDSSLEHGVPNALPRTDLQGQSPYVINAGVYYQSQKNGFQGSVLYNVFGPRMFAVGTAAKEAESIGEMPFRSLDFMISKLLFRHYTVSIGVQNALGSKVVTKQDTNKDNKFEKSDSDFTSYYPGRYYTLGVKIKF